MMGGLGWFVAGMVTEFVGLVIYAACVMRYRARQPKASKAMPPIIAEVFNSKVRQLDSAAAYCEATADYTMAQRLRSQQKLTLRLKAGVAKAGGWE